MLRLAAVMAVVAATIFVAAMAAVATMLASIQW